MRFIQSLLSALTAPLIFVVGQQFFGRRVALVAAISSIFCISLIYYDANLLITVLETLFFLLIMHRVGVIHANSRWWHFSILGALIGLAAIARPNFLVLIGASAIWLWLAFDRNLASSNRMWRVTKRLTMIGASALVVILPVTIHNYATSGEFVLISWQGGYNFYLGNNRTASGWSATAEGINPSWWGSYNDAIRIPEKEIGRSLTKKEIDNWWWEKGLSEITADPSGSLSLTLRKAQFLFHGYEFPNNQNDYLVERFSSVAALLWAQTPLYLPYGIIAPLGLLGIALSLRRWRELSGPLLMLAFYGASIVIFFVCARYRQPLIPFLLLFAAVALTRMWDLTSGRAWRSLLVTVGGLGALLWLSNREIIMRSIPDENARDHLTLGDAYRLAGDERQAAREFEVAARLVPSDPAPLTNLGMMAGSHGRLNEAESYFLRAATIAPRDPLVLTNLGMMAFQRGRNEDARRLLDSAFTIAPDNHDVTYHRGLLFGALGELDSARTAYQRTLQLYPNFEGALAQLRTLDSIEGKLR